METLKERRIKYIEDKVVQDKKRAEEVLQTYIKEVEEWLIEFGAYRRDFYKNEKSQLLRKELIDYFSTMEDVYIKEKSTYLIFSLEEFKKTPKIKKIHKTKEVNNDYCTIALGVVLIICLMFLMIVG